MSMFEWRFGLGWIVVQSPFSYFPQDEVHDCSRIIATFLFRNIHSTSRLTGCRFTERPFRSACGGAHASRQNWAANMTELSTPDRTPRLMNVLGVRGESDSLIVANSKQSLRNSAASGRQERSWPGFRVNRCSADDLRWPAALKVNVVVANL